MDFNLQNSVHTLWALPVMAQGMLSALFVRIPLCMFFSVLPNASLTLIGLASPLTTVFGIVFFGVCWLMAKRRRP